MHPEDFTTTVSSFYAGQLYHQPKVAASLCLLALTLAGCQIEDDLGDIFDTLGSNETELIEGKGSQLAAGEFRNLRPDGNGADGNYVVAIKSFDELAIIPFEGGDECTAGAAWGSGSRFSGAVARPNHSEDKLEALIPFITPPKDDRPRTLRFTDFECNVKELELPHSGLPLDHGFADKPGFISQTDEGELWFLEPWSEKKELIAEDAVAIQRSSLARFAQGDGEDWMWTIERGQIVARDKTFEEVARVGSNVTRMLHSRSGEGGPMIAYRDDAGLSLALVSELDSPRLMPADVCGESFSSGANGRQIFYYQPCADGTLMLEELDTGVVRQLGTGIVRYRTVGAPLPDGPILLYLTSIDAESGAGSDVGELWAKYGAQKSIKIGNAGNIRLSNINSKGQAVVVRDWDQTGGTLARGPLGGTLETLATGVSVRNSFGIISDFDGLTGDLQLPNADKDYEVVARDLTTRGMRIDHEKDRALMLSNFDPELGEGTLTLIENRTTLEISEHVRPNSYQFTGQFAAITLLSDLTEAGTASLKIHDMATGDLIDLAEGVTESLEIGWPKAGMLYSVVEGDDAGIWFTKAR